MKINEKKALSLIMDLLKLDGVSGEEGVVADFIVKTAVSAGAKKAWIKRDQAHLKSPKKGQTGNIVISVPGTVRAPRVMLSAHIDTVEIARGSVPVKKGNFIVPKGKTALGADDRSGTAALLFALINILKHKLPHPPLTFLFTVQEEIGLFGARYVTRALLKRPSCCFNFDGREPNKMVLKAPSSATFSLTIKGLAAHAGQHPDRGVSAALIFARGLAAVEQKGMFGEIKAKGKKTATSNIGVVTGGTASNVVTDCIEARGEARSYSEAFLQRILKTYQSCFDKAARSVRSADGTCGKVIFTSKPSYTAFSVSRSSAPVRRVISICKDLGLAPIYPDSFGGLDANWLTSYGIPTVTVGAGEMDPHTPKERLSIPQYLDGCRLAIRLAQTGGE